MPGFDSEPARGLIDLIGLSAPRQWQVYIVTRKYNFTCSTPMQKDMPWSDAVNYARRCFTKKHPDIDLNSLLEMHVTRISG